MTRSGDEFLVDGTLSRWDGRKYYAKIEVPTLVLVGRFTRLEGDPCGGYAAALAASWRLRPAVTGPGACAIVGVHRLRSNCPTLDALGILPSAMPIPSFVVVPSLIAPAPDFETISTVMLVVLAAGVGWFLWRRK